MHSFVVKTIFMEDESKIITYLRWIIFSIIFSLCIPNPNPNKDNKCLMEQDIWWNRTGNAS